MKTIYDAQTDMPLAPMAATIGMFDGVHRGHRMVIDRLRAAAASRGLRSGVVTFASHPQLLFHPDCGMRLLTSVDEKTRLLAATGLDYAMVFTFTHEFAAMTARDFMAMLRERFNVRLLVVGYDHHFGRRSDETADDYRRYGDQLGIEVVVTPELTGGCHISSSAIRQSLAEGDVAAAAAMLGRGYTLTGTVTTGKRNGRLIGFPTANIDLQGLPLLVPADGVYAVRATVGGDTYGGMLNIGTPSVSADSRRTIEVNIFNFDRDIYGATVTLEFVARVRDCRRMDGLDDLRRQLSADRIAIQKILTQPSLYEYH